MPGMGNWRQLIVLPYRLLFRVLLNSEKLMFLTGLLCYPLLKPALQPASECGELYPARMIQ